MLKLIKANQEISRCSKHANWQMHPNALQSAQHEVVIVRERNENYENVILKKEGFGKYEKLKLRKII